MVEQVARHQDGTPSRGARRGDILDRHPARSLGFVLQQANQCVQVGSQLIFASEMGDHALLDFLALAHRLDQTQVLMTTIGSLDRAKEHTASCGTTYTAVLSAYSIGMLAHSNDCLSLHFFAAERSGVENTKLSDYGPPKSVKHALAASVCRLSPDMPRGLEAEHTRPIGGARSVSVVGESTASSRGKMRGWFRAGVSVPPT